MVLRRVFNVLKLENVYAVATVTGKVRKRSYAVQTSGSDVARELMTQLFDNVFS